MVTLQDILDMVGIKFPHAYVSSTIITMINNAQRLIFRTLYRSETAALYDLVAGSPFYPVVFSPDNIIDVVVNGREYPYQNIKYDGQSHYYYITDENYIGLYPTPTEDIADGLTVFYYKEPAVLSSVYDVPDLDPAWHMLLVYHACRELAAMAERTDMVNAFIWEINNLEKQFHQSRRAKPHKILDVYGVGRGAI